MMNFKLPSVKIEKADDRLFNILLLPQQHPDSLRESWIQIGIYPYNNDLDADSFSFLPYEKYVEDIHQGIKTPYYFVDGNYSKVFAMLIAFLILLVFLVLKPNELFSIESTVSLATAYIIAKELWGDFERWLINNTRSFKLRFIGPRRHYQQMEMTTMLSFFDFARKKRNSADTILADRFEYNEQSNSKFLSLSVNLHTLDQIDSKGYVIGSLSFANDVATLDKGFLIVLKYTEMHRHWLFFTKQLNAVQAYQDGKHGIIEAGNFVADRVLTMDSIFIWRLKYYLTPVVVTGSKLLEFVKGK